MTGQPQPGPILARLSRPASRTPTRLGVIADAHLSPTGAGTWKVYHRTEQRLRTAVDVLAEHRVDAVLALGDLTRDGRPEEYAALDAVLSDLSVPLLAVPGNHDVPKRWDDYDSLTPRQFASRYARGRLPFRVGVGGVDVIGLDSAHADGALSDTHEGRLTEADIAWLDAELAGAQTPVVTLHHNIVHPAQHIGGFPEGSFYQLTNADALCEVLVEHDVPLALSGHLHWPATATVGGVRELIAPATCSFPQAALVIDVDERGTVVRMVPLAGPKGVSEAYILAREGNAHSQGIAAHADRDAFDSLPLVDEWAAAGDGADPPAIRGR